MRAEMKKSKRKPARKASKTPKTDEQPSKSMDRRQVLRWARNGAVAAVVVGASGVFGVRSVRATINEHDLSRVGQGKPTIVQIHDPSCSECTALQRETRKALRAFEECDIVYLVANIRTAEGSGFARRYGVPHVTLLLFDGQGELYQNLTGVRDREELGHLFRAFYRVHSAET